MRPVRLCVAASVLSLVALDAAAQDLPPQPPPPAAAPPGAPGPPPWGPPPPAGAWPGPPPQWGAPPPYPGYYYPPPGAPMEPGPEPKRPRNSVGMMVGGIVATSVGGILAPMGVIVFAAASSGVACDGFGCRPDEDEGGKIGGTVMIVSGVCLIAVGIPLIVIGGRRKSATEASTPEEAFRPELRVGARAGELRMRF